LNFEADPTITGTCQFLLGRRLFSAPRRGVWSVKCAWGTHFRLISGDGHRWMSAVTLWTSPFYRLGLPRGQITIFLLYNELKKMAINAKIW